MNQPEVDGSIRITIQANLDGKNERHYEWLGGRVVRLDEELAKAEAEQRGLGWHKPKVGSYLVCGPWTVKVLGFDWAEGAFVCERVER